MTLKKNYKLILISIAIISVLCIATVYGVSDTRKTVIINPQSEYGMELTTIAEKAIEEEGIDANYIAIQSIVQDSPDTIMLTFRGAQKFSNGVVYTNTDFNEEKPITFFAADLDRYGVYTYQAQPENGKIYDKNAVLMDQTFGSGKDYLLYQNGNSIELIDSMINKTMFVFSDSKIVQDENKTNTIADEINSKYDFAQQPLPIDKEKPYIIIDVTVDDSKGWLVIEVAFYKGQLNSIHIEEGIKEFSKTTINHSVNYFDNE